MARIPPSASALPSNRQPREDGTKYRVRDREGDPPKVWDDGDGQGLTYQQALVARDRVSASKRSRSMVIEPMPNADQVGAHDLSFAPEVLCDGPPGCLAATAKPPGQSGTDYQIAAPLAPTQIQGDGVVSSIPTGHQLLVNGQLQPVPTRVHKGDTVECRSLAQELASARAAASAAVAQVIQAKRRIPMDVTVRQPAPRVAPPPPDRTVSSRPVVVRLGAPTPTPPKPLPSPLKVATLEDGDVLPDDALTDADLPDIAGDLGGGPSDADVEHARKQAETERAR
jgi:hypothetical protein